MIAAIRNFFLDRQVIIALIILFLGSSSIWLWGSNRLIKALDGYTEAEYKSAEEKIYNNFFTWTAYFHVQDIDQCFYLLSDYERFSDYKFRKSGAFFYLSDSDINGRKQIDGICYAEEKNATMFMNFITIPDDDSSTEYQKFCLYLSYSGIKNLRCNVDRAY